MSCFSNSAGKALRTALAAGLLATAALSVPALAADIDCSRINCIDVERLPGGSGVNMGEITRRAQRFYGVDAKVYIVDSDNVKAQLPYMVPHQGVIVTRDQIHIPEIYHAITEAQNLGGDHYVWHYIIGHEMAHVFQSRKKLLDVMTKPLDSVVLAELHADFMSGYFLAREYGLSQQAIDGLLHELKALPTGRPGEASYHGGVNQRFYMATQGALAAFRQPPPELWRLCVIGVNSALDLIGSEMSDDDKDAIRRRCL